MTLEKLEQTIKYAIVAVTASLATVILLLPAPAHGAERPSIAAATQDAPAIRAHQKLSTSVQE